MGVRSRRCMLCRLYSTIQSYKVQSGRHGLRRGAAAPRAVTLPPAFSPSAGCSTQRRTALGARARRLAQPRRSAAGLGHVLRRQPRPGHHPRPRRVRSRRRRLIGGLLRRDTPPSSPRARQGAVAHRQLLGGIPQELAQQPVLLWRRLEALVYHINGQEPNSWQDPRVKALALGL